MLLGGVPCACVLCACKLDPSQFPWESSALYKSSIRLPLVCGPVSLMYIPYIHLIYTLYTYCRYPRDTAVPRALWRGSTSDPAINQVIRFFAREILHKEESNQVISCIGLQGTPELHWLCEGRSHLPFTEARRPKAGRADDVRKRTMCLVALACLVALGCRGRSHFAVVGARRPKAGRANDEQAIDACGCLITGSVGVGAYNASTLAWVHVRAAALVWLLKSLPTRAGSSRL